MKKQTKTALYKQIKDNLKNGYGVFEGVTDQDSKDNYLTSSKVLEALKDSEQ
jgi:hypothetical protein